MTVCKGAGCTMVSVQTVIDWSMTLSTLAFADANLKFEVVELRLSLLLMFMLRNMLATVGADLVIKLKKSDFEQRVQLKKISRICSLNWHIAMAPGRCTMYVHCTCSSGA